MSKEVNRVNFQGCPVVYFDNDSGRTEQHHKSSCDINNIMGKFSPDVLALHASQYKGQYGDFADLPDYHTAMNAVRRIDEMFLDVPADIRSKFQNDPAKFLNFVNDPVNVDAMYEMGLLKVKPSVIADESQPKTVPEGNETPSLT